MSLEALFLEKTRLLKLFLEQTRGYKEKLTNESVPLDERLNAVDELTDLRELNVKTQMALDMQIESVRSSLSLNAIEKLQGNPVFRETLNEVLNLIKEIQLTDQSLFLYIQSMGSEVRSQILKSLKDKEAVSKFKSQSQTPTGDEIDRTV